MKRSYIRLLNRPTVTAGILFMFMNVFIPTFANSDWCEFVNKKTGEAQIMLHGYIGKWQDIQETQFIAALHRLEDKHKKIKVSMNTGGGDVYGGNAIYNAFKDSPSEITMVVDGIAASMGSVILQSASPGKRMMQKNAKLMTHRITGGVIGDAQKMREAADMMEDLEEDIAGVYAEGKGETVDWVKDNWMKSGQDKWMNAKEALENGLIDEIVNDKPTKSAPKNILDNPTALWKFYNEQLITVVNSATNDSIMDREKLALSLGLSKDATVEEINTHIASMTVTPEAKENADLKKQLQDIKDAQIKELLDNAVKEGKITAEKRETYENLAKTDYESVVTIIGDMKGTVKPSSIIDTGGDPTGDDSDKKTWDFNHWRKKDPKGLHKMRLENEEDYNKLRAAYDPSNPTLKEDE